jgi:hypothetical protein
MDNIFEKRKKELLDQLAIDYAPIKNPFKIGWASEYTSTEKYSQAGPFNQELVEIKRSLSFFIFIIAFSIGWICVMFYFFNGWAKWILSTPCIGMLTYCLIYIFDRKVQMRLDRNGIWCRDNNITIPWELVGPTYIKKEQRGKTSVHFLLVYHYHVSIQDFELTEMEFQFLDTSVAMIAAQVEYFKKKATKPVV